MRTLGSRIRIAREQKDLSQQEFARQLHVTRGAISQWENDAVRPSHHNLVELARILHASVEWLMTGIDTEKAEKLTDDEQIQIIKTAIYDYIKAEVAQNHADDDYYPDFGYEEHQRVHKAANSVFQRASEQLLRGRKSTSSSKEEKEIAEIISFLQYDEQARETVKRLLKLSEKQRIAVRSIIEAM